MTSLNARKWTGNARVHSDVLANPPFNDSDWRDETFFIDARKLGTMADRTHRELLDADIAVNPQELGYGG